jgi:predicted ATP-grasp superfamily ATP-dependent carboligase
MVAQRSGSERVGDLDSFDILILDASVKQTLASARSLGRAGLRVALGEAESQYRARPPLPAFRSRYCARAVVLPDYARDPALYVAAIVAFVRDHHVKVVLPTGDPSIAALSSERDRLAELGCTLALASPAALEVATDKDRTLAVAAQLGIPYPKSIRINSVEDLPTAVAEFGFPFVLKPTVSWTGKSADRVVPVDVVDKGEAVDATTRFLAAGSGVLAQLWACGRREGVSLFVVNGEVVASCGHVAHRTSPQLGGASVMRQSIPVSEDILDSAVRLVKAIGLEGVCEVEFRRDASGSPLLMEVNPRLAGTIENAIRSGVDFPLMIWQWATQQPIQPMRSYRTGIRTRWLHGDLRWLWENKNRTGRPDSVSAARGLQTFLWEFSRTRRYDYVDWRDLRPALAELRYTSSVIRKSWRHQEEMTRTPLV